MIMCYKRFQGWNLRQASLTCHNRQGRLSDLRRPVRLLEDSMTKINPRYANGNLRRKYRARFKAMAGECGICRGKFGPIHYDEPSDAQHPLSFVIDEIHPVSKWREYGYSSAAAAARDWSNLQPAHYCCNAMKGAKVGYNIPDRVRVKQQTASDGAW